MKLVRHDRAALSAVGVLGVLAGCVHPLPPSMAPDEVVEVHTADGWVEGMRHYRGPGPPVLLVHGLGANHYNFDYREEVSLADALRDEGWDVWIPALRGDPATAPPSRRALRSITFDDHAERDLPAAIEEVLARTGRDQLYWVGHSMGGMLLYATLARDPDKVVAGVAICSPAAFEAELDRGIVTAAGSLVAKRGRLPARAMARLTSPLGRSNPEFARLANRDNLDWAVARGLARHALVDIPNPVARQFLGWIEDGAVVSTDGRPWVAPADVPVLALGAPVDRLVAAEDVKAACEVLPDCTYRELSVAGGFTVDYGHVDPAIGRTARAEVYPVVLGFLAEHDPSARLATELDGPEGAGLP